MTGPLTGLTVVDATWGMPGAVTTMVLVQDDVVLRLWQRLTLLPKLR